MTPLLEQYDRVELGIDGNCGFALLGPNLQEGEAEFVEIPRVNRALLPNTRHEQFTGETEQAHNLGAKLSACKQAFENLRTRLGNPKISFYFGPSHPYGN